MRYCLSIVFFVFFCVSAFAQPSNDDCSTLTDLGIVPFCPDTVFYTNVDATESDIGIDNFPTGCDNGDVAFVGRDVWFKFTTDAILVDYTITCTGITDGMGSTPMSNPQVMVYRGDCSFNNLSLVKCGRALDAQTELAIDVIGLDPNTEYFIRINDWSGTASPNAGSFQLCIGGLDPVFVMGEDMMTGVCEGTLYDSGGEMGDYENNENNTFTLCPNEFHECIVIDVSFFNTENILDVLNVYEGEDNSGLLIASLTGASSAAAYLIEASSNCVTFEFTSDGSVVNEGFALTWECTVAPCGGSSVDNPTVITDIPYDNMLSTCGEAATIAESPCNNAPFLNGPDYVFTYESPGDICASILITGADNGTGVLVLNGPPGDPSTTCVSQSTGGTIGSANFQAPGTYYIIVANAAGCTDFNITIQAADCTLSPALVDALCNPLNGCQEVDSTGAILPSILFFEDGFQDIDVVNGLNSGCWFGVGSEPDFYWFSIEAQADGPFGFILESADNPSDIDFNVWGPFTEQEVCDSAALVINFIENNEPLRSSFAGGAEPTGLADVHPGTGDPVVDTYDCDGPGINDDFVSTIAASVGEHYIVLVNDWGNQIAGGGIQIDWAPSGNGVLDPDLQNIAGADTTLCSGEMLQLQLPNWISTIQWITNTNTLSCDNCSDPIATPTVSTTYQAIVTGICLNDTVDISVFVYDLDAGADITVCMGEEVPLNPGVVFPETDYIWTGDNLSCNNCAEPVVTTNTAGNFTYIVEQIAENCSLFDTIELTVLSNPTPAFEISDSTAVCFGDPVELGDLNNDPNFSYVWTSDPDGLNSTLPNPTAFPVENTTFYVTVMSGLCPVPVMDSVFVRVDVQAVVDVANDTLACQGEVISLGNTVPQPGVEYTWSPGTGLDDPNSPNPVLTVAASETYVLTSVNGTCTRTDTVLVEATVISIDIENDPDSITICRGEEILLTTMTEPNGITVNWTSDNGSFTGTGGQVTVAPDIITEYYATVNIPGCTRIDTFLIDVDSIPWNLDIFPMDTSACINELLILSTQAYQQADFPDIDFEWTPMAGQESPDSLLNMVIRVVDTITYYRTTTNGVCMQVDSATVNAISTSEIFIDPPTASICLGETVNLLATSPDVTEFTWVEDPTLSCLECPDPMVTPAGTQTYIVEGEFEGCAVMATIQIVVTGPPTLSLIGDSGICPGENIDLNPMTADPEASYSWTSDPGTFTSTEANPTVSPTVTTTYFVTTSNNNGICPPVTDQVTIEVLDPATVDAGEDVFICENDFEGYVLTATGNSNTGDYFWSTGSTSANATAPLDEPGTTVYYVEFDNNCGPPATDSVIVTVYPFVDIDPPFIFTPPDMPYNEGTPVVISANTTPANVPIETYEWKFNEVIVPSTTNSIEVTMVNNNSSVSLLITTADGCQDYEQLGGIQVIEAGFEIPNAFTPDADGVNDYFNIISTIEEFSEVQTFQVYNRWGQLVYDNDEIGLGWDGTVRGKPAPSDVYIYRIVYTRPSGEVKEEKGDVTLIR